MYNKKGCSVNKHLILKEKYCLIFCITHCKLKLYSINPAKTSFYASIFNFYMVILHLIFTFAFTL